MQVKILHLGDIILALDVFVERLCQSGRFRRRGLYFKQFFSLLRGEHIGISNESLLNVTAFADKEIDSSLGRQL